MKPKRIWVKKYFLSFYNFSKFNPEKPKKRRLEGSNQNATKKKVKVPSEFITHISSLGFGKEDASRLYNQKDDWMGISTGGKLSCVVRGCSFYTKVSSDELFEHCRVKHQWKDYPCKEDNCSFVAYCSKAFNLHSKLHSAVHSNNFEFRCSHPNCNASFDRRLKLKDHENLHANVKLKCVFCPYTCARAQELAYHQRAHFNIRDFKCNECDMSFFTQRELNNHFNQKHSGLRTKCPICEYESTRSNVYYHLKTRHKITRCHWDKETSIFNLPIKKEI